MKQIDGQNSLIQKDWKKTIEDNEIEICVFGKGYGECILIGFPNGEYVIIDSFLNPKTNNPIVLDYLTAKNVEYSAIKVVVLTHWHNDHICGISNILNVASEDVKVVLSPIIRKEEFNKFISIGKKLDLESVDEFFKVYDFIEKKEKSLMFANVDKKIYSTN